MPHMDGIEATARSRRRSDAPRVLMLTTFDLDDYVYAALRAGASGFLLKDAPAEQLIDAVRVIARGDALLAPSVTRLLIEEVARRPASDPSTHGGLASTISPSASSRCCGSSRRAVERRDRRGAVPRRGHGEDPRGPGPDEARSARSGAGRRGRLRVGSGHARRRCVSSAEVVRCRPRVHLEGDTNPSKWGRELRLIAVQLSS